MPIFSYVAVVIDTDGSAFITKAEFDSLKNNFQAQIDSYNSSIDSKIDGAIASYLSGIQMASDFPQIIPFSGGRVMFQAFPSFTKLNNERRYFYYNPFAMSGAVGVWGQFHKPASQKIGLVEANDAYRSRVFLLAQNFVYGEPTYLQKLMDFNHELFAAAGCNDVQEFAALGKTEAWNAFIRHFGFNVICFSNDGGGRPVFLGMGIMDSTYGHGRTFHRGDDTIYQVQGTPAGGSRPQFKLNDTEFANAFGYGLEDMRIGGAASYQYGLSTDGIQNQYALFSEDTELKTTYKLNPKEGTWYFEAVADPMLFDSDGGYSPASINLIHPLDESATLTWKKVTRSSSDYQILGCSGNYMMGNASTYATGGFSSTIQGFTEWTNKLSSQWDNYLMWSPTAICKDVTQPILSASWFGIKPNTSAMTFYCAVENDTTDTSWLDEKWPAWKQGSGPQFSNLENVNEDGSVGGTITYVDKLFKEGCPWYEYRPEVYRHGNISMADGTIVGYMPFFKISPAESDLISVKDLYCAQYASDTMMEYGKSIIDGACICKCSVDGNLEFDFKTNKACNIYFSKEPFQSARDKGNVTFSVDGNTYNPGDKYTYVTGDHKVRINGVMAGERYYIKSGTPTTLVTMSNAHISRDN